jgi:hypothetical protein
MRIPLGTGLTSLLLALSAGMPAQADDDITADVDPATANGSVAERAEHAVAMRDVPLGTSANGAPRFTRNDVQTEAQRSPPGLSHETSELGVRWWKSAGRADVGFGVGTLAYVSRPTGSLQGLGRSDNATVLASGTVLTLGMRYRTSERSAIYADAAGWRGDGFQGNDGVVGKVGLEFKSAQSRWSIAYGGLGMRLSGDTRMTLRVRHGGLGIYMRSSF